MKIIKMIVLIISQVILWVIKKSLKLRQQQQWQTVGRENCGWGNEKKFYNWIFRQEREKNDNKRKKRESLLKI